MRICLFHTKQNGCSLVQLETYGLRSVLISMWLARSVALQVDLEVRYLQALTWHTQNGKIEFMSVKFTMQQGSMVV